MLVWKIRWHSALAVARAGRRAVPLLLAATALLTRSAIGADAAALPPLRLGDVIERALRANPELRAAHERSRAAGYAPSYAAAYDDPVASWEAWNVPESQRIDRAGNNIFKISQRIPFPGKRSLAGRVAAREADMAAAESRATELEVRAAVKRAYYRLWQAHRDLVVYSRDEGLVERFAKIAERKYAVGQVSQPDVLRAQVELTRLVNRVTTESLAIDDRRAELNALLSRPPAAALGAPEDPPPPRLDREPAELIERALHNRPAIAAEAAAIERERTKLEMARLDYFPDFEVSFSRFVNYRSSNGFGVMASISLPFAYQYKYDARLDEARARLASARAEERRVKDRVAREVEQAFLRARTALLQRDLFVTTHIPQAEAALGASEIGYDTGKVDFLSLIDSLRAVESIHLEHLQAESDFETAFADLERAVGERLSRGEAP